MQDFVHQPYHEWRGLRDLNGFRGYTIGALIIRIAFWGILYYKYIYIYNKGPTKIV